MGMPLVLVKQKCVLIWGSGFDSLHTPPTLILRCYALDIVGLIVQPGVLIPEDILWIWSRSRLQNQQQDHFDLSKNMLHDNQASILHL
jgi:hypothetical protein